MKKFMQQMLFFIVFVVLPLSVFGITYPTDTYTIHYNLNGGEMSNPADKKQEYYWDNYCKYVYRYQYYDDTTNDLTWSDYVTVNQPYMCRMGLGTANNKDSFGWVGWCVYNSEQADVDIATNDTNCPNPVFDLTVSDAGDKWVYAKYVPINTLHYNLNGGRFIASYITQYYWYTNDKYKYKFSTDDVNADFSVRVVSANSIVLDSLQASGYGVTFRGWCAYDSEQPDPIEAAKCNNPIFSLSRQDAGKNWLYATWTATCDAGYYARMETATNMLYCSYCEKNYYCPGDNGNSRTYSYDDITEKQVNNKTQMAAGIVSCAENNPNRPYSDSGASSVNKCSICPVTGENTGHFGSAWFDLNGDGQESITECISMYWDIEDEEEYNRCYMQLVYGDESEATLREWFGDDYDYYFGTPCDYSKIGVSYMTCRYNAETYHDTQWHHYTDCSSVIRDCVGNDAVTIINAEYNTYSADVFPVELTAKNIDQNNLNNIDWDEYFYQHLERYQQDIYNPSNLEHYENACYTTWTHSINYHNLSGATNNNPISYTASLLPMELSGLSRDRYTFMGWCSSVISGDDVECPAGDLVTEIPVGSITDIDLYATWRTSYEFFIDTTKDTVGEFTLYISAAGRFFIDWGDDSPTEVINKSDTDSFLPITHTYETQKSYTISIGGTATDYSEEDGVLYINYDNGREFVAALRGSLGHVFPTIRNSNDQIIAQPKFKNAFSDCTSLESISADLFDDVTGATSQMFYNTFAYTPIASIHSTLFSGITGAAAEMFAGTFAGTSITSIPATLFSGITGAATEMFAGTFAETQITFIPAGLFNGVTGAAEGMFSGTFAECTELGADPKITNPIPATLFEHVTGAADYMYSYTFLNCTSLQSIPENLFSGVGDVTGVNDMFLTTFYGCTSLTHLPNSLFPNITGTLGEYIFYGMFYGDTDLSGYVPPTLFANLTAPNPYPDTGDDPMEYIFEGTNLDTSCTAPLIQYTTGFESDWSGKVSCIPGDNFIICGTGQKAEGAFQCVSCSGEPHCPNQSTLWMFETNDSTWCEYDLNTDGCVVYPVNQSECTEMTVMGATMCLIDGLPGVNTKALIARKDGQTYHMLLSQTAHTITSISPNQLVIIDSGGTWYAHDESVK